MKIHPINVILIGSLIASIGFNILVIKRNIELESYRKKPIIIFVYPDKESESLKITGM
jgi:hypothetical protein